MSRSASGELSGKVALVTGGSRGLGRAMALGFARAGADVAIASRKLAGCEAVVKEIEALGRKGLAYSVHADRTEELDALVEATCSRFGRLDVVVNNAATNPAAGPLVDSTGALFDKVYGVNVKGPLHLAARAAQRMAQAGGGVVINVITQGAFKPGPGLGLYCSSKAALYALTKVMAQEWASWNVRVNALAPGPFMTDMMKGAASIPGYLEMVRRSTVMKRIAEPDELVGAALFLASDASSYMTGQALIIDGGILP
ncbi:MAG TPA: short-chain dehydrogenase [Deltaproteobacteria bacterium]|jgi:NAD(P)-dependent dehydrogenase (short-subunit alcohol dehydrogenase family)|nr:short-chain dehydrogenase [Deltaproteobacteria bacterium]